MAASVETQQPTPIDNQNDELAELGIIQPPPELKRIFFCFPFIIINKKILFINTNETLFFFRIVFLFLMFDKNPKSTFSSKSLHFTLLFYHSFYY